MAATSSAGSFVSRQLRVADFLDRSCLIYGSSGSGKSTAIRHIMHLMRGICPTTIVFCSSDCNNHIYSGALVPPQCIYEHVTIEALSRIADKQSEKKRIYDSARDLKSLRSLFDRCARSDQRGALDRMAREYESACERHGDQRGSLTELYHEGLRDVMIPIIRDARDRRMFPRDDLSEEEKFSLKWLTFNPRILMIFDDVTSDFKEVSRAPALGDQIFKGRHILCTNIIALHGHTGTVPIVRTNAYSSIFMDPATARSYASAATTNGLSTAIRDEFVRYSSQILKDTAPYTKMIFKDDQCALCTFNTHSDFDGVTSLIREFCSKCAVNEERAQKEWMRRLL